ncbi:MAG: hypothetical protein WD066_04940 [Planctomycetaceae bacterium]
MTAPITLKILAIGAAIGGVTALLVKFTEAGRHVGNAFGVAGRQVGRAFKLIGQAIGKGAIVDAFKFMAEAIRIVWDGLLDDLGNAFDRFLLDVARRMAILDPQAAKTFEAAKRGMNIVGDLQ